MNVSAARLHPVPPQGAVTRPSLDVTVSDAGVQQHAGVQRLQQVAPAPQVAPVHVAAPTSTAELAASLSTGEKAAITERFATLPRGGVTGSGIYDPRGRTPKLSTEAQVGQLLDLTG